MKLIRTFLLRFGVWAVGLLLLHGVLRTLFGLESPWPFFAGMVSFAGPMAVIAAFASGVGTARASFGGESGPGLSAVCRFFGAAAALGVIAYAFMASVAPTLMPSELAGTEPRATTSAAIRTQLGGAPATIEALPIAERAEAWQSANSWAFEHERRIVQALLLPVLALIGLLTGFWSTRLRKELRPAVIWGMGFFLISTMYFAAENGFELLVLRSAGPMAFVPWLQGTVPAGVLIGMLVPLVSGWAGFAAGADDTTTLPA